MQLSAVTIRQAAIGDLDAIAPLFDAYRQFYGRPSDVAAARAFLLERFRHAESVIFVAFHGDEAVGFTQLYPSFSSVSLAPTYVLNDLFVAPAARKLGAGRQLLDAAVEFARAMGAAELSLETGITNRPAQALYESRGWRRDDEFCVYHLELKGY